MISKALHKKNYASIKGVQNEGSFLPGSLLAGSGYDIWGQYADTESVLLSLLRNDFPTKDYDGRKIPEFVNIVIDEKAYYKTISGETIKTMQESLSTATTISGKYNNFSGSLSVNYDQQSLQSTFYKYSFMIQSFKLYSVLFDFDSAKAYLSDQAKDYLDNKPVEELFKKYGTHFLNSYIMGAKATMASSIDKRYYKSSYSLDVATEMTYKTLTNQISADNKTKYASTVTSFNSNALIEINTIGGDATLGGEKILEGGIDEWSKTVNDNPVLIDFPQENALLPIWEFCSTEERKKAVQDYFPVYALAQKLKYGFFPDLVTDVDVIQGNTSAIEMPTGFKKCEYDLNTGSGGAFIYTGYRPKRARDIVAEKARVITDLTIIKGQNAPVPDGFEKIGVDLNAGAGGEYLYLCYKRGDLKDDFSNVNDFITSLMVIGADYSDVYPPDGYIRINQDCNAGAEGKYVYICYSK